MISEKPLKGPHQELGQYPSYVNPGEEPMDLAKIYRKIVFRFLKFLSVSISALLAIFFNFDGCISNTAPEYGVPSADYKISGSVLSSDQLLPIKGLSVSIRDTLTTTATIGTTKTDSLGWYSLQFSAFPRDNIWKLNVEDVDANENGSFMTKDTTISILQRDLKGASGNWYQGHAEKTVDLKLDRKI
jgi:putative lipoprotein (rSAM/lipoprotein system)